MTINLGRKRDFVNMNKSLFRETDYNFYNPYRTSKNDVNFAIISDLHFAPSVSDKKLEKILNRLRTKQPDYILFPGDLIDCRDMIEDNDEKERLMDELVDAISTLAKEQTGALITFERTQSMIDYINTGTKINADIRSELFLTIFWEGTPLHDGATITQGDRVACAAAFYPPTNKELSPKYGARHRAAIGISEITDSLTVVVSEETGTISFATNGELRKIPIKELRASLVNELQWFKSSDEGGQAHES